MCLVVVRVVSIYMSQVFTLEGKFLRKFGKQGEKHGEFKYPQSIAIDSDDNVYVSDGQNKRVQIFRADGTFITAIGEKGKGAADHECELNDPRGVCIDKRGRLVVTDKGHGKVLVLAF